MIVFSFVGPRYRRMLLLPIISLQYINGIPVFLGLSPGKGEYLRHPAEVKIYLKIEY